MLRKLLETLSSPAGIIITLLILAFFPLFLYLPEPTIFMWDESLRAVNAADMLESGDPLVVRFNGEPDLRNTKPPLVVWLMTLSIKFFGYNTLALRLPAALAGLLTVAGLLVFSRKYLGTYAIGFWAGLVLLTSAGFTGKHITRTGDIDAHLVLFLTMTALFYFIYLQQGKPNGWGMPLSATCLTLAVLSKGIAGFLPLPGLFLYTVFSGKLKQVFQAKAFYASAAGLIAVIGGYILLREQAAPGYVAAMMENDITGRFQTGKGGHEEPFFFYIKNFIKSAPNYKAQFWPWIYLVIPAFLLNWGIPDQRLRALNRFAGLTGLVFLLVISTATTKIYWYSAPLYPHLALIIGIGLYRLWQLCHKSLSLPLPSSIQQKLLAIALTLGFMTYPYYHTMARISNQPKKSWSAARYQRFLTDFRQNHPSFKQWHAVTVLQSAKGQIVNGQLLFLRYALSQEGVEMKVVAPSHPFREGEVVISCDPRVLENLKHQFQTREIHEAFDCQALVLLASKPS